jgi:hypothetical protein
MSKILLLSQTTTLTLSHDAGSFVDHQEHQELCSLRVTSAVADRPRLL